LVQLNCILNFVFHFEIFPKVFALMSSQPSFDGLRVAALESRNREEMSRMIERFGGVPFVSPSMREVPLEDHAPAVDFAHRLMMGEIDIVILMTGVGFRYLMTAIEKQVDTARFLNAMRDVTTVARGPKPIVVMKEFGLNATHRIPEPNTWREIITYLDAHVPLNNSTVALQEYGKANPSLIAGLEARGANVITVKVYQWALPDDTQPLRENIQAILAGERQVVLCTSAHQVVNLFEMASLMGVERELQHCLRHMVVASVGPTTSDMLRDYELPPDVEPEHPKMGPLVMAAAERAAVILQKKGTVRVLNSQVEHKTPAWQNSLFLQACRGEATSRTPVWLMRQAGRYMKEYREVRAKTTFLELCKNPQLCSEVMCTAVERTGVDAAIIFSDLLPMLEPMGIDLEFAHGEGPVIHNPIREARDLDRFTELEDMSELQFVMETVTQTRKDLPEHIPLIGFAGAPFTLASYAIEGGSSRNYLHTKTLMMREESIWHTLMNRLTRSIARYLNAQIAAGAQCVQIFDSWVGCLGPDEYRRYVLPHMKLLFSSLTPGIPVINFGTGNPQLIPLYAEAGGNVIGLDWRIRLDSGWNMAGNKVGVQGNLDPTVLLTDRATIRQRVKDILEQAAGRPGHIFNLGHGVLQQTPVENAIAVVEAVKELSQK
jgi:uroporphyrinogen decarboxylase